jgi:DNA ligase-1
MRLVDLARVSDAVAAVRSRREKVRLLAECVRELGADEREVAVGWLTGVTPGGKLNLGPAAVFAAKRPAAAEPTLTLADAAQRLAALRALRGAGVGKRRELALGELFSLATEPEQRFVVGLLLGELRQGALEGHMVEAVAAAAGVEPSAVRRAAMLAGSLPKVAAAALESGRGGLERFVLTLYEPVAPMLASPAEGVTEALAAHGGSAVLEYKLDGARVQIHKGPARVRVYSRARRDVTASVPDIAAAVAALAVSAVVLDGEVLALQENGRPRPFQETMRRFGRRLDVAAAAAELPLALFCFDCLHVEGVDLIDRPLDERLERLTELVPPTMQVARSRTSDQEAAAAFLDTALAAGHEGIMVKAAKSLYQAGQRGAEWLKIKPAHTLDLVVLAAEWGNGRRRGWLSNLHLGARDPHTGGFVMLGKTFKGLTDELLAWQTEALRRLATGSLPGGYGVQVAPRLVVEIAFNELQSSPRYPGGLALRFARVVRYRPDKGPEEADTIETVREIAARGHAGGG